MCQYTGFCPVTWARFTQKYDIVRIVKINYTCSVKQGNTLDQQINTQSTAPAIRSRAHKRKTPPSNLEDLSPLLDTLLHHSKAISLSGMEKYYAQYTQHTAAAPSSALPPCLAKSMYDESLDASDLSAVLLACEKNMNAVCVMDEQASAVEEYTSQQHLSCAWYNHRSGRITASKMHAVLYSMSPLWRGHPTEFWSRCVTHTQNTQYHLSKPDGVSVMRMMLERPTLNPQLHLTHTSKSNCGFNSSFPEIGASPDGLTMCECCGKAWRWNVLTSIGPAASNRH